MYNVKKIFKTIMPIFLICVLLMPGNVPVYANTESTEVINTESETGIETETVAETEIDAETDSISDNDEDNVYDDNDDSVSDNANASTSESIELNETLDVSESHTSDDTEEIAQSELALEINSKGGLLSASHSAYSISLFSDNVEIQVRQRAKAALAAGDLRFDVSDLNLNKNSDVEMLSLAVSEVINSGYQYFYIDGCMYTYNTSTGKISYLEFKYSTEYLKNGVLDMDSVQSHLSVLENAMSEALSCIEPGMSELEKVLAIHDYIVQVCDYDVENLNADTLTDADFSTWGVLIDGKAVCQGYAEAFCSLITKLGIDSYFVGSRAMNHAWNLVYLDGYWYHLDATWDDPTFAGTTFYRRKNNDYADEGYVSHGYFLKSDSEFKSLGHYGWSNSLPQADKSGSFSSYCFYNVNSHMNYYNAYWYYLNPQNRNLLYKAKIDGSSKVSISLLDTADYVHKLENSLYYSNENGIYQYDLTNGEEKLYFDIHSLYPGFIISEFTIKHGQLIGVLYNSAANTFKRESITATEKFIKQLLIYQLPDKRVYEYGEALDLTGIKIKIVYSDSSQQELTDNYTITGYNPNKIGTQTVKICYNGIYTDFSVTVERKLQSITLNYTNLELDPGTRGTLTVSFNPEDTTDDRTIIWSSSNTSIAVVSDQGEISALKPGTVTIIARSSNGKTAMCKLTVVYVDPVEAFVRRLYENILQRKADASGLAAWSDVLKSGKEEGAKVAQGFIDSKEFKARTLSDEEYIKILYRTFLGREADASGLKSWLSVIDSGLSRMHVFRGFAESDEFTSLCSDYGIRRGYVVLTEPRDQNENVTKFVVRCYKLCLGRNADVDGLNGWCRQLLNGANTAKEAAHGFVLSQELLKKNLSNENFVKTLYRLFMDREADPEGLKAWLNVLESGKDREHVFNGFADSLEFKKICQRYGIQ